MPYQIAKSSTCPSDRPYATVKVSTGEVMGCHRTAQEAGAQIAAIERSEATAPWS